MSNYTSDNLINISPTQHARALRIDNTVFVFPDSDLTSVTAQSSHVLSGYQYYTSKGELVSGTIPIVSPQVLDSSKVYISKGYIQSPVSIQFSNSLLGATVYLPTTSDLVISSGYFLVGPQTILGDPHLLSSNIKYGETIFQVTGTFTQDATAKSSDIIKGKIAYVKGERIQGQCQPIHQVFMCVSVQPPFYTILTGDTYGGSYYYDSTLGDGYAVYTNGSYYIIHANGYVDRSTVDSAYWRLHSSRSFDDPLTLGYFALVSGTAVTTQGQLLLISHDYISQGTWTGHRMLSDSLTGYYYQVSDSYSFIYTSMVPSSGQMYTADALIHIDQIWRYEYRMDIKSLDKGTANQLNTGYSEVYGVSGSNSEGWFMFGDGAYLNYTNDDYQFGGGCRSWKASLNEFTVNFKFKYEAGTLNTQNITKNLIFASGIFGLALSSQGQLQLAYHGISGYASSGVLLQPDTEHIITLVGMGYNRLLVIANDTIVFDVTSSYSYSSSPFSQITLHFDSDNYVGGSPTYYYKHFGLWGRRVAALLPDMQQSDSGIIISSGIRTYTSASLSSFTTVASGTLVVGPATTLTGATVSSGITSGVYSSGLYVMRGGTASDVTVTSDGYLIVQNGGSLISANIQRSATLRPSISAQLNAVTVSYGGCFNGIVPFQTLQLKSFSDSTSHLSDSASRGIILKSGVTLSNNSIVLSEGQLRVGVAPKEHLSVLVNSGAALYIGDIKASTTIVNSGTVYGSYASYTRHDSLSSAITSGGNTIFSSGYIRSQGVTEIPCIDSNAVLQNYGVVSGVRIVASRQGPTGSMVVHSGALGISNYIQGFTTVLAGGVQSAAVVCSGYYVGGRTDGITVSSEGLLKDVSFAPCPYFPGVHISSGGLFTGTAKGTGQIYVLGGHCSDVTMTESCSIMVGSAGDSLYTGGRLQSITLFSATRMYICPNNVAWEVRMSGGQVSCDSGGQFWPVFDGNAYYYTTGYLLYNVFATDSNMSQFNNIHIMPGATLTLSAKPGLPWNPAGNSVDAVTYNSSTYGPSSVFVSSGATLYIVEGSSQANYSSVVVNEGVSSTVYWSVIDSGKLVSMTYAVQEGGTVFSNGSQIVPTPS